MKYAWIGMTLVAAAGLVVLSVAGEGDARPGLTETAAPTSPPRAAFDDAPTIASADEIDGSTEQEMELDPELNPVEDADAASVDMLNRFASMDGAASLGDDAAEAVAAAAMAATPEPPVDLPGAIDLDDRLIDVTSLDDDAAEVSTPERPAAKVVAEANGAGGVGAPTDTALRALRNKMVLMGHELKGRGTAESPFEITWDLLATAHETYRPKLGKTELPEWAELLHGSHVRVVGYVLFAEFASESDELLLMKNQWDGCCIGLPPTPYDAVEVKLGEQTDAAGKLVNYGTVRGTLEVDPYVVNDWLLSLYVLKDGVLESVGLQGEAGHVGPRSAGGGW
ncbi:MAG: hypothetical protein AAGK04_06355 [Planctomycetota bacterium]